MNALPVVDMRSDTITRPTPAMRKAIAEAVVGDDVFGDDPTVLELERRCAALAGKEAALFVASGTMGNQLAVNALTAPGDQVLLEAEAHIFLYEQGGIAANSGCLAHVVPGSRGQLPSDALGAAIRSAEDDHVARISLICTENTHNRAGGTIVPLASLQTLAADAHARGVRVHLDGARLWNASVASGVPIADWAATADTVMMCFSKALGAPVGSILVGDSPTIRKARRTRKRWGGGMRQVGILAAACLHALDHHIERLAIDHVRAKLLAAGMRTGGVSVIDPETNIVIATLPTPESVPGVLEAMNQQGVGMVAFGPGRIRAICHLDIDDKGVDRAIEAFQQAVTG